MVRAGQLVSPTCHAPEWFAVADGVQNAPIIGKQQGKQSVFNGGQMDGDAVALDDSVLPIDDHHAEGYLLLGIGGGRAP